jgi:hypothetical protein
MVSVEVDEEKHSVLEARAEEKGYETTDEYVDYLFQQIVEKIKREKQDQSDGYTDEEEEKVKNRLRDLGYMG